MNRKSLADISKAYDDAIGDASNVDDALFARLAEADRPVSIKWPRLAAAAVVLAGLAASVIGLSSHSIEAVRSVTAAASPWSELVSPVNRMLFIPGSKFSIQDDKLDLQAGLGIFTSMAADPNASQWQRFVYSLRTNFGLNYEQVRDLTIKSIGTKYLIKTGKKETLHIMVLNGSIQIGEQKFKAGDHIVSSAGELKLQKLAELNKLQNLASPGTYDQKSGSLLDDFIQVIIGGEPQTGVNSPAPQTGDKPAPKVKKKVTKLLVESGSELIGDVVSETDTEIKISVEGNIFTVEKKTILSRKVIEIEK